MSYDDDDRVRRRENLMQQRLRKARGEEVGDDLDDLGPYDDDDDRPRGLGGGYGRPVGYGRPAGGGCAQASLYLLIGGLAALLVGALFFNQALGGLGQLFQPPDIATIIATPTPRVITGASVVQRVQQLARLETASYSVQTVIEVRQDSNIPVVGNILAGDALLLIAQGTVVAGVDMGAIRPEDVTVAPDGSSVTLRLPPAQIFGTSLDSEKTRVYSRERGWFAPENKDLETLARQQAEAQILQAACEDGVLSKATAQAETAMRQFVGLIDDVEVVIVAAPPAACGAAPAPAPLAPTP